MSLRRIMAKFNKKSHSTTDEVRRKVREEHAKVTEEITEGFDQLNWLLKDAIDTLNKKPAPHDRKQ